MVFLFLFLFVKMSAHSKDISQKNGYSKNATIKEYRLESLLNVFSKIY